MNTKSKYNTDTYIGKTFNDLTVLKYLASNSDENKFTEPAYLCRCSCGNITIRRVKYVVNNVSTCCEACSKAKKQKSKYDSLEYIGKTFGILKVEQFIDAQDERNTEKSPAYLCKCKCGNTVIKKASHVISGSIKSCGKCHISRSKYANEDFIGQTFGKLKIIGIGHDETQNTFICNCECGRSDNIEYPASMIYSGYRKQCNICSKEISIQSLKPKRYTDSLLTGLIGRKFGKLTIKYIYRNSQGRTIACCDCDCGTINHTSMLCNILRENGTQACGKCRTAPNEKYGDIEFIGQTFNGLTVIDIKKENGKTYWKCRCNICDEHNERWFEATNVVRGNNKSCGCMTSYGEYIIEKALKSRNINYRKQVTFNGLTGIRGGILRFDFGIYDDKDNLLGLIEYDGNQHFTGFFNDNYITEFELYNDISIIEENDKIKNEFCKNNNIQLVRLNGNITEDIFFKKMAEACSK